jgi:hypothetical protein
LPFLWLDLLRVALMTSDTSKNFSQAIDG